METRPAAAHRRRLSGGSIAQTQRVAIPADEPDETTPLVAQKHAAAAPGATRLPMRQITILALLRFCEPIAFSVIFPFITRMIDEMGVTDNPKKLGYYAGIVEALFALTTFLTVLHWGALSDRIGRKPVLLIGLTGVSLSVITLGFSKRFWQLVVARSLGGALNGNIAVLKSMIAELTDETNIARAFSFLPLSWNCGVVIGPLLGGYLSNPAERYPNTFAGVALFETFPYALPCMVAGSLAFIGIVVAVFSLQETLPAHHRRHGKQGGDNDAEDGGAKDEPTPPLRALLTRRVLAVLGNYALLAIEAAALEAIFVLFCYTSPKHGGLGFNESDIGRAMSAQGVLSVFAQVVVFPPAQRKFGTVPMHRFTMSLYPLVFALFPAAGYVAKLDVDALHPHRRVWGVVMLMLTLRCIANMSFATNMILVASSAPSRRQLGSLNGVAQMTASVSRTIGPLGASSLFAFTKEHDALNGQLVWVVCIAVGVATLFTTRALRDESAWRKKALPIDDDDRFAEED